MTNKLLPICFCALLITGCSGDHYGTWSDALAACRKDRNKRFQKYIDLWEQGKIEDGELGGFTCFPDEEDKHYKLYTTKKGGAREYIVKRFYWSGLNPSRWK